jgi:hypothetical protein
LTLAIREDFSFNLFGGPEKGRFSGTDATRPRARAEEDARSVHLLIGSMPAVSSGMRRRLSVSIHVAGRPRLPPALFSVRLHLSASAQTAGTCAALRPTRSSRAGSGRMSWAAIGPC